nr:MAG TPA: hypothetical protein [Caudoviricetes sp.]DAZ62294.1 MAG TPA: hypothetical protein [Caudoviricetes sp.]
MYFPCYQCRTLALFLSSYSQSFKLKITFKGVFLPYYST